MSRSARLLDLIQALRRHRRPVTAADLAGELGISIRTVYRDIATLAAQGVPVEGEAGLGYVLRPGFMLPPLMFGDDEIEALVLGLRWVAQRGDGPLGLAAQNATAKITAVLPADLKALAEDSGLVPVSLKPSVTEPRDLTEIRRAIRTERKLRIAYTDGQGRASDRTIWPFALAFMERIRMVAAWCETRQAFRHFRTDRIVEVTVEADRYPRRRHALLADWKAEMDAMDPEAP
ncbi:helix-turn-helix transcriptional regulator [Nitrospirillum amazonense]|uniref:Putative DNA-binding transcriptional regulator YafY n=1 Tax=Nitrospirillum amazonense TaxID=28077 RepID=A0A560KNX7_9PROT|nr:YafY family protein [Nitrospirillum amazonense]MDG3443470.1 YafY family protein [Nitrospirillum amazonense]TWB82390.1 putative DNA-binding transcriptional regulator YafY [Nitrospirillum amazonense]